MVYVHIVGGIYSISSVSMYLYDCLTGDLTCMLFASSVSLYHIPHSSYISP